MAKRYYIKRRIYGSAANFAEMEQEAPKKKKRMGLKAAATLAGGAVLAAGGLKGARHIAKGNVRRAAQANLKTQKGLKSKISKSKMSDEQKTKAYARAKKYGNKQSAKKSEKFLKATGKLAQIGKKPGKAVSRGFRKGKNLAGKLMSDGKKRSQFAASPKNRQKKKKRSLLPS